MKVKELIEELQKYNEDAKVVVFTEGSIYPTLLVGCFDNKVGIGCGWEPIKETVDE